MPLVSAALPTPLEHTHALQHSRQEIHVQGIASGRKMSGLLEWFGW